MKDGVYFINVSRGELVNTNALAKFAKMANFEVLHWMLWHALM